MKLIKTIAILCVCCILVAGLCACGIISGVQDSLENIGDDININIDTDKLQDMFNQGVESLESLLLQGAIQATGEANNNEAGNMHVYADKIVITVKTDDVRAKMTESKVTVDSLKAERANAATAQMEYVLRYQYMITLQINGSTQIAVCYADVTEDTLNNTIDITIPINNADMGVTVYELLQGGSIQIDGCLQHGTDKTKSALNTYYLNSVPEGKTGNTLTMQDHRDA